MANTTRRLALHYPSGGDSADVPSDVGRLAGQLDGLVATYGVGPLASRPRAGVEGRLYYATDVATLFFDVGGAWVPSAWSPGDLRWSASGTVPDGWLACDRAGKTVSRSTYAALFAAIGTTWGVGDGSTTFGLPDPNRVLIGATSARPVGTKDGAEMVTLTTGQMPAHGHGVTDPGHSHGIPHGLVDAFVAPPSYTPGGNQGNAVYQGQSTHSARTGISIQSAGGGQPHNNMQPWQSALLLIKY